MSVNLLDIVKKNLGLHKIKKVDPNLQVVKNKDEYKMEQAILPAILAGIYNLARNEEGLNNLATAQPDSWTAVIFGQNTETVVEKISKYCSASIEEVKSKMNLTATEAIEVIRKEASGKKNALKAIIHSQRNNILPFLPADLQLGYLLNDNTIDDRTNKMQGPLSSLMHKIESGFSGNETIEEANSKHDFF